MEKGDKVAVVTGASSGLGMEIAKLLCKKEMIVYVVARSKDKLLKLQQECKSDKGEIKIISGDLSEMRFRESLITDILSAEGKIDYLVNNAGFGRAIEFQKQKSDEIKNMLEVNVEAYMHLSNLVLKKMKHKNSGRIINVGSVVAFTPLPYFTIYNSTKAAVYMFNRSLRYELKGSKVTSTVVLPARMKTGFANKAYDCYMKNGKKTCVEKFNESAGSPAAVAKAIVKKIDSGKEVITPTFKAKLWYFMRYLGFVVDFSMKNILGPKEKAHLKMAEMEK